jgi:hypothetical protein
MYFFQTEDQYIFIHDAILESCLSGLTEVSARNLHSHLQRLLMDPMSPDQPTGMELEFKVGSLLQFSHFIIISIDFFLAELQGLLKKMKLI